MVAGASTGTSENRKPERIDLSPEQAAAFADLNERLFYEQTEPAENVIRRRLREYRKAQELSAKALAEAMTAEGFTMYESTISNIENGPRHIHADELLAFAHVLDVPFLRLVSPLDGEPAVRFGGIGLDRIEVGHWLVTGEPWPRERTFGILVRQIQAMRQALADERSPEKRTERTKRIGGLIDQLWQASGIRRERRS